MRYRTTYRRALSASLGLSLIALCNVAGAVPLTAISGPNTLVTFDSATPGTIRNTITVTGLAGGETLVAIDRRPINNVLYVVTSMQRVYLIESCTGVAVNVGLTFDVPLTGANPGLDFNPTVDRLRFTSEVEENFRSAFPSPRRPTRSCRCVRRRSPRRSTRSSRVCSTKTAR